MKPICRAPMAWTWLFTGFFPSEVRFRPWSSGFSRTEALGTSKGAPTSCQQTMVQPTSGNQPINQPSQPGNQAINQATQSKPETTFRRFSSFWMMPA